MWCVCVVLCVVLCCVVCGVVCDVQNVPVCVGNTSTCVTTCGRGAGTHGDVLNLHTEVFETDTRGREGGKEGEGSPSVLLTMRRPT